MLTLTPNTLYYNKRGDVVLARNSALSNKYPFIDNNGILLNINGETPSPSDYSLTRKVDILETIVLVPEEKYVTRQGHITSPLFFNEDISNSYFYDRLRGIRYHADGKPLDRADEHTIVASYLPNVEDKPLTFGPEGTSGLKPPHYIVWKPIDTAPKIDGFPIFARGHNAGDVSKPLHYYWTRWSKEYNCWLTTNNTDPSKLLYLIEWTASINYGQ